MRTDEEGPLPVLPPDTVQQTTTTQSVTTSDPSWFHANVRNIVLVALLTVVCFLALRGVVEAIAAVLATFSTLAGATWGSRDALKVPGKDS